MTDHIAFDGTKDMNDGLKVAEVEGRRRDNAPIARRFPAYVGCFDRLADRATMDDLVRWIEQHYQEALRGRPSMHVYVRSLPVPVMEKIDVLRDSASIHAAIAHHFDAQWVVTPMKHTDELYISHYNKDYGGDHGLFGKHYDGNLRFLPVGTVVRALIYLQSDATYSVVFGDSKVAKAFSTYEFGLLDFHRELHWVEGRYDPNDQQRIVLKCNYLVAKRKPGWLTPVLFSVNTGVFYVVKAAMEYSKSPANPMQFVVGLVCNLSRLLNNFHPLLPLAVLAFIVATTGWGLYVIAMAV